jgi:NADPH2:quinone reductase
VTGQGAYAEAIILPAGAVVRLPDDIEDTQAAAILLKAMTVDYLFNDTFPLHGGETVLFHAAAGGVGLIACQWARHLGVSLIGTASTQEKCTRAIHHGAEACLILESENIADELNAASNGGFRVIYDSVGKSTYELSLHALAPFGTLVSFGNASGPIEAVSPAALASLGSLYFTRPTLFTFLMQPGWMQKSADKIFALMQQGILHAEINQRYRLEDVQRAHEELEGRKTTGCSIILP